MNVSGDNPNIPATASQVSPAWAKYHLVQSENIPGCVTVGAGTVAVQVFDAKTPFDDILRLEKEDNVSVDEPPAVTVVNVGSVEDADALEVEVGSDDPADMVEAGVEEVVSQPDVYSFVPR